MKKLLLLFLFFTIPAAYAFEGSSTDGQNKEITWQLLAPTVNKAVEYIKLTWPSSFQDAGVNNITVDNNNNAEDNNEQNRTFFLNQAATSLYYYQQTNVALNKNILYQLTDVAHAFNQYQNKSNEYAYQKKKWNFIWGATCVLIPTVWLLHCYKVSGFWAGKLVRWLLLVPLTIGGVIFIIGKSYYNSDINNYMNSDLTMTALPINSKINMINEEYNKCISSNDYISYNCLGIELFAQEKVPLSKLIVDLKSSSSSTNSLITANSMAALANQYYSIFEPLFVATVITENQLKYIISKKNLASESIFKIAIVQDKIRNSSQLQHALKNTEETLTSLKSSHPLLYIRLTGKPIEEEVD